MLYIIFRIICIIFFFLQILGHGVQTTSAKPTRNGWIVVFLNHTLSKTISNEDLMQESCWIRIIHSFILLKFFIYYSWLIHYFYQRSFYPHFVLMCLQSCCYRLYILWIMEVKPIYTQYWSALDSAQCASMGVIFWFHLLGKLKLTFS